MDFKVSAERLRAVVDDCDYEPSGLITPNDRAELARRKAEYLRDNPQEAGRLGEDGSEDERPYSLLLAQK